MSHLVLVTGPQGTGKSTIAEAAAEMLGAALLGWDWVMAGLTPFAEMQEALRRIGRPRDKDVGWSMLRNLAIAQLRAGRSVVLDGIARDDEIGRMRKAAADEGARCVVIVTRCRDLAVHRTRIEGRERHIPGWYELSWEHVAGALGYWTEPVGADLYLDAVDPLGDNIGRLATTVRR